MIGFRRLGNSRALPILVVALGAAVLAVSTTAGGTSSLQQKAEELARLRSDLDLIEADLRAERTRGQSALRNLENRRSALSMQLDAERVRGQSARKKLADLKSTLEARKDKSEVFLPVVESAADALADAVRQGLPFHNEERLSAIEEIKTKARTGRLDPETACSRLWQLIEDELRLTGEIARTKVPLALDGPDAPRRLVDVIRIGMVTMYIRHEPGRFSHLRRRDGAWEPVPVRNVATIDQLEALFDSVSKQVLQGDYVLPLPPVEGRKQ